MRKSISRKKIYKYNDLLDIIALDFCLEVDTTDNLRENIHMNKQYAALDLTSWIYSVQSSKKCIFFISFDDNFPLIEVSGESASILNKLIANLEITEKEYEAIKYLPFFESSDKCSLDKLAEHKDIEIKNFEEEELQAYADNELSDLNNYSYRMTQCVER